MFAHCESWSWKFTRLPLSSSLYHQTNNRNLGYSRISNTWLASNSMYITKISTSSISQPTCHCIKTYSIVQKCSVWILLYIFYYLSSVYFIQRFICKFFCKIVIEWQVFIKIIFINIQIFYLRWKNEKNEMLDFKVTKDISRKFTITDTVKIS